MESAHQYFEVDVPRYLKMTEVASIVFVGDGGLSQELLASALYRETLADPTTTIASSSPRMGAGGIGSANNNNNNHNNSRYGNSSKSSSSTLPGTPLSQTVRVAGSGSAASYDAAGGGVGGGLLFAPCRWLPRRAPSFNFAPLISAKGEDYATASSDECLAWGTVAAPRQHAVGGKPIANGTALLVGVQSPIAVGHAGGALDTAALVPAFLIPNAVVVWNTRCTCGSIEPSSLISLARLLRAAALVDALLKSPHEPVSGWQTSRRLVIAVHGVALPLYVVGSSAILSALQSAAKGFTQQLTILLQDEVLSMITTSFRSVVVVAVPQHPQTVSAHHQQHTQAEQRWRVAEKPIVQFLSEQAAVSFIPGALPTATSLARYFAEAASRAPPNVIAAFPIYGLLADQHGPQRLVKGSAMLRRLRAEMVTDEALVMLQRTLVQMFSSDPRCTEVLASTTSGSEGEAGVVMLRSATEVRELLRPVCSEQIAIIAQKYFAQGLKNPDSASYGSQAKELCESLLATAQQQAAQAQSNVLRAKLRLQLMDLAGMLEQVVQRAKFDV